MKPVVANASEIFENLIAKFKASDTDKKIQKQTNQILGKLQRIFYSENLEQFKNLNGEKDTNEFIVEIENSSAGETGKILIRHTDLFRLLQQKILNSGRPFVIFEHEDNLIEHSRGDGSSKKSKDYQLDSPLCSRFCLDEFRRKN